MLETRIDGVEIPSESNPLSAAYAKVSWRLIPILFVCNAVAYLDRVNIGFAKLAMQSDLQFSDLVYGLGAGIFFTSYLLFEIPVNMIVFKAGARRSIATIMIVWGIASGSMMFIRSPASFYVLRFLLGAAESGFLPAAILYLTGWYPAQRRGKVIALFMAAIPASSAVGSALSGWILQELSGWMGFAGWQWLFVLEALPSTLMGVLVLLFLPDRIALAPWLRSPEKLALQSMLDSPSASTEKHGLKQVLLSAQVWRLGLVYFCLGTGLYVVGFWMPTIIKASGVVGPMNTGLLTAIPYVGALIGMIALGHHSDKVGERRWHVAAPVLLAAFGIIFGTVFGNHTVLAMLGLTIGTTGIISAVPVFWGLSTANLRGAGAAVAIALINAIGNVAGIVSTVLVGWITQVTHSTNASMFALATVLALGAAQVLTLSAGRNQPGSHASH